MPSLKRWNERQIRLFERYHRRYGVPLTCEVVARLARRYAERHAVERSVRAA